MLILIDSDTKLCFLVMYRAGTKLCDSGYVIISPHVLLSLWQSFRSIHILDTPITYAKITNRPSPCVSEYENTSDVKPACESKYKKMHKK